VEKKPINEVSEKAIKAVVGRCGKSCTCMGVRVCALMDSCVKHIKGDLYEYGKETYMNTEKRPI